MSQSLSVSDCVCVSVSQVPLAIGLPLELFADGTLTAGAAAEVHSRIGQSFRNLTEVFNGDVQFSAR